MGVHKIIYCAMMLIFVGCGGSSNENQQDTSKVQTPKILKDSSNLEVKEVASNKAIISIKTDKISNNNTSFYKIIIKTLNQKNQASLKSFVKKFELDINNKNICKSVSNNIKECKIYKDLLQDTNSITITGLENGVEYSVDLEFCNDNICTKDEKALVENNKIDDTSKPNNENTNLTPPKNKEDLSNKKELIKSKIIFSLSGWDDSQERLSISLQSENEKAEKLNQTIEFAQNGQNIYDTYIIKDTKFKAILNNNSNQICISNFTFNSEKISTGKDELININCKSDATLEPKVALSHSINFEPNKVIDLKTDVKISNLLIQTDKIHYYSTATDIANVDKNGKVTILKEGSLKIIAKLDEEFYRAKEIIYELDIIKNEAPPTNTTQEESNIIFDVKGYDDSYAKDNDPEKMPAIYMSGFGSNPYFIIRHNGKNIRPEKIRKNATYFVSSIINRSQICVSNIPFNTNTKIANGQDIIYNLDCKTDATLIPTSSTENSVTLQFNSGQNYKIHDVKVKTSIKEYTTDKVFYTSSDPETLDITENGELILKKEGTATIKVQANPIYYNVPNFIEYKYKIITNTTGINIQDIHFGQISILSTRDKFHILAAKKDTIVRAFIYSINENENNPTTIINFKKPNGEILSKTMTCPAKLKKGAFKGDNYDIGSTCYTLMKNENEKSFITKGVEVEVKLSKDSTIINEIVFPKVADEKYLNIYLVRGKNKFEAQVSQEDIINIKETLINAFPIAGANIRLREQPITLNANVYQALNQISSISQQEAKAYEFTYGLVPGQSDGSVENGIASGVASYFTGPGVGRDKGALGYDSSYLKTMAHEIGHMIGLKHALCGPTEGIDANWLDDSVIDWADEAININGVKIREVYYSSSPMYIPKTSEIINPRLALTTKTQNSNSYIKSLIGGTADLMGYCEGNRLSKYNYQKVALELMNKDNTKVKFNNKTAALINSTYKTIIQGKINFDAIAIEPISVTSNDIINNTSTANSPYYVKITTDKEEFVKFIHLNKLDHINDKTFQIVLKGNLKIAKMEFFKNEKPIKYKIKKVKERINSRSFSAEERLSFKNNIIKWSDDYQFMSAVFIAENGARTLLANSIEGGFFKISNKLKNGELEIILSDGLNNIVEKIQIN